MTQMVAGSTDREGGAQTFAFVPTSDRPWRDGWQVQGVETDKMWGVVTWHRNTARYVFRPDAQTAFGAFQLREIARFCFDKAKARRTHGVPQSQSEAQ